MARIETGSRFLTHVLPSHDAQILYAATPNSLLAYKMENKAIKKLNEIKMEERITAMVNTEKELLVASGEFTIRKIVIDKEELMEKTIYENGKI